MLIDSKNIILGRLASFAAKHALLGENVDIVNCESAVITGNKKRTFSSEKRTFLSRITDVPHKSLSR